MPLTTLPPGTPEIFLDTVSTKTVTTGYLTIRRNGVQLLRVVSIELPWKDNANGISCVPAGDYPLVLERSAKFGKDLWELKDVPGRSECKIHVCNYVSQLEGCIGPGEEFRDIDRNGIIDVVKSEAALQRINTTMGKVRRTIIHVRGIDDARILGPGMNGWANERLAGGLSSR